MEFVLLFPGQGSQQPGMGKFLHGEFQVARETFEEASDAIGIKLQKLCFDGSAEDLALTENTQPCLLTVSVATQRVLQKEIGVKSQATAGHSVGEYAALVAAGSISFASAVKAVRQRGLAMQSAVPLGKGGMAAILGLTDEEVIQLCQYVEAQSGKTPLSPANFNCPGQVVISGNQQCIEYLVSSIKSQDVFGKSDRPFKTIVLKVSAPFHCSMMDPAQLEMKTVLDGIEFQDSKIPVVQNRTATMHQNRTEIKMNLLEQISAPVLWTQSMRCLIHSHMTQFIECGTGKVLQGLLKKIDSSSIKVFNTNSLQELKVIETASHNSAEP